MTIRQRMLRTAGAARKLLRESADRVVEFVRSRVRADGGIAGRGRKSDLYYTVFGLECLRALGAGVPRESAAEYLKTYGDGAGLDLVHLSCLARAWADVAPEALEGPLGEALAGRIEAHRARDGGYGARAGLSRSSAYGTFLALGALQDLGRPAAGPREIVASLRGLRTPDGGFSNEPGALRGSTTATAAVAMVFEHLGEPVETPVAAWIVERAASVGGFVAAPGISIPDLLSTATALFALKEIGIEVSGLREPCLDFVDSLWSSKGAFRGQWMDHALDCEYTFYGLLSLGSLA
ncbi:MAG: prenyltransferase/squalene oxidase repeat-containing protein [Planctomycetota bacterium]